VRVQSPSEALALVNAVLLRDGTDRFCTVVLARLRLRPTASDRNEWLATIALGGHPLPFLKRAGSAHEVGVPGSIVGPFDDPNFVDFDVVMRAGDSLLFYTDGVTEGRRDEEFYGENRLAAAIGRHAGGAQSLAGSVLADVLDFQRGNPRDDIAIVVVGVSASGGVKA
jgi:sigma-B regulation protein RsbU (phosphoserine phosphatase)